MTLFATDYCCAGQVRTWHKDEVLVLDDAFEHEVWNDAPSPRIVLCLDIWHPEFSHAEVQVSADGY